MTRGSGADEIKEGPVPRCERDEKSWSRTVVCPNKAVVSIKLDRNQRGILIDVQCRGANMERLALIRTFRYILRFVWAGYNYVTRAPDALEEQDALVYLSSRSRRHVATYMVASLTENNKVTLTEGGQ